MASDSAHYLSPRRVDAVLRAAGIPQARSVFAPSAEDVAQAFVDLSATPAVLKAAGLAHKSDLNGVVLGLTTAAAAEASARAMLARLGPECLPFAVQQQAAGLELLVGLSHSERLGTALVVGLGGVYAEIHRDTARRLLPVTVDDTYEMLRELRSWPMLSGYRGFEPVDVDALSAVLLRVAALADASTDFRIDELDLNPVMVGPAGQGCLVVDARIATGPAADGVGLRSAAPDLDRMLRPRHIAVVGVSDDATKAGARLFRHLVMHGFDGRIDAVHFGGGEVNGRRRYASLDQIDGSPDLVCIAVPAGAVPELASQAVAVGAGGVVVHSSGFAEAGGSGARLQQDVADVLGAAGIPLAGPNCMGIVAPQSRLTASISAGLDTPTLPAGSIAVLTSSGALGSCIATRLMGAGVGLSYWIHVGNEVDLEIADYLAWLSRDPSTRATGLLLEGVKSGPRLIEAGRQMVAAGKPMFAFSMARSEAGGRAALSHTGAVVGSYELREDVVEAAGMVSVPSLRVLEDVLVLASAHPLPAGRRLMAVTFSGGAATIIADECERLGVELPPLSDDARERVARHMPSFAAVANPLDVSFQMVGSPESFDAVLRDLLAVGGFDALLIQFTTNADPYAEQTARVVTAVAAESDCPVYVSRFGAPHLAPRGLEVYTAAGIPLLDAPDRAVEAIARVMPGGTRRTSQAAASVGAETPVVVEGG